MVSSRMLWVVIWLAGLVQGQYQSSLPQSPTSTSTVITTITSTVDCGCYWQTTTILSTYTEIFSYLITLKTTTTASVPITLTETVTFNTSYPVTVISDQSTTFTSYTTLTYTSLWTVTNTTSTTETATTTLPPSTIVSASTISVTETTVVTKEPITGPGQAMTSSGTVVVIPASTVTQTIITNVDIPIWHGATTTNTNPIQSQITKDPGTANPLGIVVCPVPTNTVPAAVQDTGPNSLWGCSSGFICSPPKPGDCDLWANPPNYNYICDAKHCIPSPPFTDVVWLAGNISYYPITEYFNLNPTAFGLDYGIFIDNGGTGASTAFTRRDWKSRSTTKPRDIMRRIGPTVPAVCYTQCNNCYIEAQKLGKSPLLCASNSAFQSGYQSCQACIAANRNTTRTSPQTYVDPKFAPFVSFCQSHSTRPELVNAGSTSTRTVISIEATRTIQLTSQSLVSVISSSAAPSVTLLNSTSTVLSRISVGVSAVPLDIVLGGLGATPTSAATSAAKSAVLLSMTSSLGATSFPPKNVWANSSTMTSRPIQVASGSNTLHSSLMHLESVAVLLGLSIFL